MTEQHIVKWHVIKKTYVENRINNLWFLWKPTYFWLGTVSENVCIGDFYQCARFHACIKKSTIHLKFGARPPEYLLIMTIAKFSNLIRHQLS